MDRQRHRTRHPGISYREAADGSRRYIVGYTDTNGKWHTKTLPCEANLDDARTLQGQLRSRRANGETLDRPRITVGELLDEWLAYRAASLTPHTYETYEWAVNTHLKPRIGRRRVTDLSATDVAAVISSMKAAGSKTGTVRKVLTPLSSAYKVAVRDGLVTSSPVSKLLPHERPRNDQREMRCVPRAEIALLLEHAQVWRPLFTTLLFTGLRISEALRLTWDDVTDRVSVRQSKTPAGVRDVMLIPLVRSTLAEHRLSQPPGTRLVFTTSSGSPILRHSALGGLKRAARRAGVPAYTLHELRHTFASILIGQGELPTLVAKQMGHADASVTMSVYAHLWEEQESVEQARDRLQEAFGQVVGR